MRYVFTCIARQVLRVAHHPSPLHPLPFRTLLLLCKSLDMRRKILQEVRFTAQNPHAGHTILLSYVSFFQCARTLPLDSA